MEQKQSFEDYLETILLLEELHGNVRSIDVANFMNFTRASVSIAVKKLENENYIVVDRKDFYLHLTKKGRELAESILHRHRVLTKFFIALGVNPKTAEEDACKIEHDISEESFAAFEKFLAEQHNK